MTPATDEQVRATLERPSAGRRYAWIGAVVLVLVLGGVAFLTLRDSAKRNNAGFETVPVERGDLAVTVTAVGKLQPLDEVSVSSELSGIVRHVYVDTNDPVQQGQLLAELDTRILTAQARQSHATVEANQAALQQALTQVNAAKVERDRQESLFDSGAASQASMDQARTTHEVAVASLALAEAQLRQARASDAAAHTNLEKTRIVSPIDGIVLERNVEAGQAVVSSLQVATLFRVARDLSRMKVEVEVDEADVGRIEPGQTADFTVAAFSDRVFDAMVQKVELAPLSNTDVVTYATELHLENPDGTLRPGMTATAAIATETFEDVLVVPNKALRFTPAGREDLPAPEPREGRRVVRVWTLDPEGELMEAEVLPVSTDGSRTVIEEGPLDESSVVVVGTAEKKSR